MSDKTTRPERPSQAQINDLKSRVGDCEAKLRAATQALHEAMIAAHSWQPGDVLRSTKGDHALVKSLYVEYGRVKTRAVARKKDGAWGKRDVLMWKSEWEKAQVVEPPAP